MYLLQSNYIVVDIDSEFVKYSYSFIMSDSAYGCVYFKSDKTISVIPKSRCILRDAFETLGEVEVKWRIQGKHQIFIGTILQVSSKRKYKVINLYFFRRNEH